MTTCEVCASGYDSSLEITVAGARHVVDHIEGEEPPQKPVPETEPGGPEIADLPLGVPDDDHGEEDDTELPGFPRGDPTHGWAR